MRAKTVHPKLSLFAPCVLCVLHLSADCRPDLEVRRRARSDSIPSEHRYITARAIEGSETVGRDHSAKAGDTTRIQHTAAAAAATPTVPVGATTDATNHNSQDGGWKYESRYAVMRCRQTRVRHRYYRQSNLTIVTGRHP